jgi:hypothetical protein
VSNQVSLEALDLSAGASNIRLGWVTGADEEDVIARIKRAVNVKKKSKHTEK